MILFLFLVLKITDIGYNPTPKIISQDNIQVIQNLDSDYVTQRDIYVRLPKDYDPNKSYSVLYMHDGQMLFEKYETWNGQNWGIDQSINTLVQKDEIEDLIVVGIANVSRERHPNYFPEKPFLSLPRSVKDSLYQVMAGDSKLFNIPVNSDDYLKFLVYELKPFIDKSYATKNDVNNTFIAGSSMGGLISMYAFFEYPDIFGGAACISTHWIGGFSDNTIITEVFINYMNAKIETLKGRKLYFDTGTETLDRFYGKYQLKVDELFHDDANHNKWYFSKVFEGAAHTENDWKERFHIPLMFLLKKK